MGLHVPSTDHLVAVDARKQIMRVGVLVPSSRRLSRLELRHRVEKFFKLPRPRFEILGIVARIDMMPRHRSCGGVLAQEYSIPFELLRHATTGVFRI